MSSLTTVEEKEQKAIPQSLIKYFTDNDVDPGILNLIDKIPRFIRINPQNPITFSELKNEINLYLSNNPYYIENKLIDMSLPLISVTPLNNFYEIQSNLRIAYLNSFKKGLIFGIDISSGICCSILNPLPSQNILDLCCAPGTKLIYIAQLINNNINNCGTVTGVDISQLRLNIVKKLIQKHRITNIRIFKYDGTIFDFKADNYIKMGFNTNKIHYSCWNKKMIKKNRRKLRKQAKKQMKMNNNSNLQLKLDPQQNINVACHNQLYDGVLVDAQCTHDGSIAHLRKYRDQWGWNKLIKNVLNNDNVIKTIKLQKELIMNGFRLLKIGGYLVYSTCSLSIKQNENIIKYLLIKCNNAYLCDISMNNSLLNGFKFKKGKLNDINDKNTKYDTTKCIRFDPFISKTSGLFIAKIGKR